MTCKTNSVPVQPGPGWFADRDVRYNQGPGWFAERKLAPGAYILEVEGTRLLMILRLRECDPP
jgi:hypothetical protein